MQTAGDQFLLVTRLDLVTAIAKGAQLLRELRALLLGARKLSASRFQRRFGDTALRSHCRLPGEKLGFVLTGSGGESGYGYGYGYGYGGYYYAPREAERKSEAVA